MAKIRTLQILRGTTAQNDAYTGSAGELTMDTTTNELRLHDGSTAGGHLIGSGGGSGYHPDLFAHEWDDHIRYDVQWLRADTFSWQNGSVYQAAYQHLADDIDGKTLQSETVAGTTIQFYLADDGHKICPDTEESNVAAIFTATGVAWYYIIDTANQRFKLPRINPDKEEILATIGVRGNGYALGLTGKSGGNTYGAILGGASVSGTGGFVGTLQTANGYDIGQSNAAMSLGGNIGVSTDVTKAGLLADTASKTSYFGGEKYLYFYVGNFTQTAIENTAGLNAELFNGKADIDLTNAVSNASSAAKETIVGWNLPDYANGVSKLPNTDYTAEFSGRLICCTTSAYGGGGIDYITVQGQVVATSTNSYEGYRSSLMADISKGDSFRITKNSAGTGWTYTFYPMKGV